MHREQIHTPEELTQRLRSAGHLRDVVIQGVSLRAHVGTLRETDVLGAVFLGCDLEPSVAGDLMARGAVVFANVDERPYDPYRSALYTPEELYAGFDPDEPETIADTLDQQVYAHWLQTGREWPNLIEGLMRRLHDLAMADAKTDLLTPDVRAVAVMGGHALSRTDPRFVDVVHIGRGLVERGFLPVSGGGPGAMEATHLGAYLADASRDDIPDAVAMLASAPRYDHPLWLSTAMRLREQIGCTSTRQTSLAVPTWLYGHEPPTPFATHIAKYFANAMREDGLVTLARHGIVFTPGSAGTVQEVFQDATQNHYQTLGEYSPMVFLGKTFWTETLPVIPLLDALAGDRPYRGHIGVVDTPDEALAFIESHPPVRTAPQSG